MSQIAIKGATTGTGVFTLESPATNTDRTLVLPDEAGTVLTTASGLTAGNLTGSVPASAMPAGSVLQVVHVPYNTQVAFTSNALVSLFSASITPTRATSKILVLFSAAFSGKGRFTIYRGGTNILPGQKGYQIYTNPSAGQVDWNNSSIRNPLLMQVFDSPSTTSNVTYTMYGASYSLTAAESGGINEGNTTYQGTSITLMEIAV